MATLSVGMGTSLTSCKDNYDELRDEMRRDNVDLNKKISDLTAVVDNLKQLQETCKANCEAAIAAINTQIALLQGDLANKADSAWVAGEIARLERELVKVADLNATLEELNSAIDEINGKLGDKADKSYVDSLLAGKVDSTYVDSLINALNVDLNNLRTELAEDMKNLRDEIDGQINVLTLEIGKKVDQQTYDAFVAAQEEINRQVEANSIAIITINETLDELKDVIAAVEEKADQAYAQAMSNLVHINALIDMVNNLQTKVDGIENQTIPMLTSRLEALEEEAVVLRGEIEELRDKVNTNTASINSLKSLIEALNKRVDRLMNRAEQQLTSLTVERVYNHVYGTLNTPFGVQSNVLLSFWGWADQEINFPNTGDAEYRDLGDDLTLTEADRAMIGWNSIKHEYDGLLIRGVDDENYAGNAGRIYFRANPGNVTMTGKEFSLVNTRDEESGVKLEEPVKSYEELMYGYTHGRGADDNGFYCAQATLSSKEDVFAVKAEIDAGLKEAAKNVLKERSLSSLAVLSKMIYDQVSNVMPQLALKAYYKVAYTDADGNTQYDPFSVYSPSNLAATAVRPLSFSFLYDKSLPGHLPILDPLTELINADDFKVDLKIDPIEFEDQTFSISTPEINVNDEGEITITADVVDSDGNIIGHLDNVVVDSSDLTASITAAIESAIGEMTGEINVKVSEMVNNIQNQIETQINNMLDSIKGQVNEQIADLINKVNGKLAPFIDRYNQFLPKYNELASRINRAIKNPNAYLQPLMVYQSSVDNNFHVLSNNINRPTVLEVDGGDAIYLHPTTRTGEVIAPAFKKFVAVTNAWNGSMSAQANHGVLEQVVKQVNAAGNMDQIIDGEDMHVVFYVPGSAKGLTFEIVYQALDYHGVTSTQKYYVKVK